MRSLWHKTTTPPCFPSLKNDIRTDVLIIGGGIAGVLTAYFLHKQGVPYVLVEKDRIGSGTTGNTTAKITFQHGLIYHRILKSGTEKARMYMQANRKAFDEYAALCKNMDCGYERRDNYVYSIDNPLKIEAEMDALSKIGYDARFCEQLPLPVQTVGAVCFPAQAQFHPLEFLYAIAKDLHIYEHTFVQALDGTTAFTACGRICADRVIVATHFPFLNLHGSYFLKLYQHRSYVIALQDAPDVGGMYVDECRTGLSFRNYRNLLLLGGEGHRTGKSREGWNGLRRFAAKHYPGGKEICCWAAQDCISLDGIPYVGPYSKHTPGLYVAGGFNKWGMTGAMLSAMLLSDMVCGKANEYAELFSPSRNMIKPQLFLNGLESAKNLLSLSKKRCPHLGCALKWNPIEHTWDCACHGSRFSEQGKILDNPANRELHMHEN